MLFLTQDTLEILQLNWDVDFFFSSMVPCINFRYLFFLYFVQHVLSKNFIEIFYFSIFLYAVFDNFLSFMLFLTQL